MAYYYVLDTGSSTTAGGTTKQTGAFSGLAAAAVYGSVADAITYGATSGDFICVSDSHAFSSGSNITWTGPTTGDPLNIVSVDDTACEDEKTATAAQETTTSGGDIIIQNRVSLHGLYLKSVDHFNFQNAHAHFAKNCTFEATSAGGDAPKITGDGAVFHWVNCDFLAVSGTTCEINNGAQLIMDGGSLTHVTHFTYRSFINGGAVIKWTGVDLSTITGTIFEDVGSHATDDDMINITMTNCTLNASPPAYFNETLESTGHRLVATGCGSGSEVEYAFTTISYGGRVDDDTAFYRDDSLAYPSGQQVSLKCVTDANATPAAPFWFDAPTRYADLVDTAKDTIRIYLLSSATLYDSDVWAELIYPDGTNRHIPNFLTTRHTNILDTNGTALTANTDTWTGHTSENRYQIDLDTSSDPGSDCVPIIRLYIAKASTTIYFDTTVDLL